MSRHLSPYVIITKLAYRHGYSDGSTAGSKAERARIRREFLEEIDSANLGDAYVYLPDLRAALDRICP